MEVRVYEMFDPTALMCRAVEITSGKRAKDQDKLLEGLEEAEHSPVRLKIYWVECLGIPNRAAMHIVRHSIGNVFFVSTSRPDRTKNNGTVRDVGFLTNHQALVNMARRRLCGRAWHETTEVVKEIKKNLPEHVSKYMVPECEYRGGVCHEPKSCGRCPKGE